MLHRLAAQLGPPSITAKHLTWKRACSQLFEVFSCKWISYPRIREKPKFNISIASLFRALAVCTPGHITLRFGMSELCLSLASVRGRKKEDGERELAWCSNCRQIKFGRIWRCQKLTLINLSMLSNQVACIPKSLCTPIWKPLSQRLLEFIEMVTLLERMDLFSFQHISSQGTALC